MGDYKLSRRAQSDLAGIADYSLSAFGLEQARRHRESLIGCFELLANRPGIGRRADQLAPGLRRYEHQSHIVFYQAHANDLLIVRVLHERMDVTQHF